MFRIDDTDATAVSPFPLGAAGTQGYFTEGNPATGVAATRVTDDWLNAVQEEIGHAIEALGGTLDKTNANQLGDLLAAQGGLAVKSHATDTAHVTTTHTRVVIASDTGRALGPNCAVIASDDGTAGGINSAVIASTDAAGALVNTGTNAAIIACDNTSIASTNAVAVASTDAEIDAGKNAAIIAADVSTLEGTTAAGSTNSAIVGGDTNSIDSQTDAAILAGTGNEVDGNRSVILGGQDGTVGTTNAAIVAGNGNTVGDGGGAIASVIVGGDGNEIAAGTYCAIMGSNAAIIYGDSAREGIVMLASKNAQAKAATSAEDYTVQGGYAAGAITKDVATPFLQNITWRIRSNGGTLHATNTTVQALDFAERFECAEPCAPGMLLAREGLKVRPAKKGDRIFGVASANPGVIGDAGDLHWAGKFLKDEFGAFISETVEMCRYPKLEGRDDRKRITTLRVAFDGMASEAPEMPDDCEMYTVVTRKLNPDYDPARAYTNRADRKDWVCVGFTGQILTRVGKDVEADDDVTAGKGGVAKKGTGKGRPIEAMAIATPYDEAKGYAVALCMVG
jgi:hypothetical protein